MMVLRVWHLDSQEYRGYSNRHQQVGCQAAKHARVHALIAWVYSGFWKIVCFVWYAGFPPGPQGDSAVSLISAPLGAWGSLASWSACTCFRDMACPALTECATQKDFVCVTAF